MSSTESLQEEGSQEKMDKNEFQYEHGKAMELEMYQRSELRFCQSTVEDLPAVPMPVDVPTAHDEDSGVPSWMRRMAREQEKARSHE